MATTEDEARRLDALMAEAMRRAKEYFAAGVKTTTTISAGVSGYCAHACAARGTGAIRIAEVKRVLAKWSALLGDPRIDRISATLADSAVSTRLAADGYKGGKVSRATVAKEVGILRAFARWAAGPGQCAPSDMPILSYRIEAPRDMHHGGEIRRLPIGEFMAAANEIKKRSPYVAAVLFGVVVFGLRPGALVALLWSMVSMPKNPGDVGTMRPPVLKNGDAGEIAIPYGSLRHRLLERCRDLFAQAGHRGRGAGPRACDPVFPTKRGESRKNHFGWSTDTLAKRVRQLADACGIPSAFTAYVGRHSAITAVQDTPGVGISHVSRYAKHRRIETQNVYSHGREAEPAMLAAEAAAIDWFDK
jgi:integrase